MFFCAATEKIDYILRRYSDESAFGGIFCGRYNESEMERLESCEDGNFVVVHSFQSELKCREYLLNICQEKRSSMKIKKNVNESDESEEEEESD